MHQTIWISTLINFTHIINYMLKLNIILLLPLLHILANAWWEKGHMLTSQIAWNHLTDLNNLNARNKFNQLVVALNAFTDGRTQTFTQAAVWADDIKSYGVKLFDYYHYSDIVYDPDYLFKGMSQYEQDVNSINTINWCNKILKLNKNGLSFQRAWMARYLLHLLGDIHQPLHNINMFNLTYKTGDQGGNMIQVTTLQNKTINLHAFIDSIALQNTPNDIIRPLNDTFRKQLQDQARLIMSKFQAKELQKELQIKDPHAWSVQSHKLAVDKIYSYLSYSNKITEEYQSEIREILWRQIALGGYRLAIKIADIYA